jgi:hypothetical protein
MIRPTNPNAMKLFLFRYREKLPGNVGSFAKAHPERVKHFGGTEFFRQIYACFSCIGVVRAESV